MVETLKSTRATGIDKIPAMTSSCNLSNIEEAVLKWESQELQRTKKQEYMQFGYKEM